MEVDLHGRLVSKWKVELMQLEQQFVRFTSVAVLLQLSWALSWVVFDAVLDMGAAGALFRGGEGGFFPLEGLQNHIQGLNRTHAEVQTIQESDSPLYASRR